MIGPVSIRPVVVWRVALDNLVPGWLSPTWQPFEASIVWDVRLPRVLLATIVGAGLAVVGAALQALLRNPLADPYLLGTSAGAALGAVGVLLVRSVGARRPVGLRRGVCRSACWRRLPSTRWPGSPGRFPTARLVLSGVAVSYLFSSMTNLLIFRAPSGEQARTALFWMLGGLGAARWESLGLPAAVVLACTAVLVIVFENAEYSQPRRRGGRHPRRGRRSPPADRVRRHVSHHRSARRVERRDRLRRPDGPALRPPRGGRRPPAPVAGIGPRRSDLPDLGGRSRSRRRRAGGTADRNRHRVRGRPMFPVADALTWSHGVDAVKLDSATCRGPSRARASCIDASLACDSGTIVGAGRPERQRQVESVAMRLPRASVPTRGVVSVDGRGVWDLTARDVAREVGVVLQERSARQRSRFAKWC